MKKNKILFQFFFLTILPLTIAASCGANTKAVNANIKPQIPVGEQNFDLNKANKLQQPDQVIKKKTFKPIVLAQSIQDSAVWKEATTKLKPNEYNLIQNATEFSLNNSAFLAQQKINNEGLKKDILQFFYQVYLNNDKKVSVLTDGFEHFNLYDQKLSLSLRVVFNSDQKTHLVFLNEQIPFVNETIMLKLEINQAKLQPVIRFVNDYYFLNWQIQQARFVINEKEVMVHNFIFNQNNKSHAYNLIFENLTNKQNYFQLASKQDYLNHVDQATITRLVSSNIIHNFNQKLKLAYNANLILKILVTNPDIGSLINQAAVPIAHLLTETGYIPHELFSFFVSVLQSKSDAQGGVLSLVLEHKAQLVEYLQSAISPTFATTFIGILDSFKPNMTAEEKEKALSLFNALPPQFGFIKSLIEAFLEQKSLLELITLASTPSVVEAFESTFQDKKASAILRLLHYFLQKKSNNGVIDLLTQQRRNKGLDQVVIFEYLQMVLDGINPNHNLQNLFLVFGADNPSFNKNNLTNALRTFLTYSDFMLTSTKPDVINNYNDQTLTNVFTNVTIQGKFISALVFDQAHSQVSFDYQVSLSLKKQIKLDLKAWWELLPLSARINGKKLPSKFLSKNFFPHFINFGESDNGLLFNFVADKSQLFFAPIYSWKEQKYYSNYRFAYVLKVFYDDFNAVLSITKEYKTGFLPKGFITNIIVNVLLRSYHQHAYLDLTNWSQAVATNDDYDPYVYTTGLTFRFLDKLDNKAILKKVQVEKKAEKSNWFNKHQNKLIFQHNYWLFWWRPEKDKNSTLGQRPYLSPTTQQNLQKQLFVWGDGFEYNKLLTYNWKNDYFFDPLFSFNLISGFQTPFAYIKSKIWFPFYVYDLQTKALSQSFSYNLFNIG